jgi:GNAT superfamily N-acetyltransferase
MLCKTDKHTIELKNSVMSSQLQNETQTQEEKQQHQVKVITARDNNLWQVIQYLQDCYAATLKKEATQTTHENAFFWDSLGQICTAHHGANDLYVSLTNKQELVGYMTFDYLRGTIDILEICAEYRQQGYGKLLVDFAQKNTEAPLHCSAVRKQAEGFWTSLGFKPIEKMHPSHPSVCGPRCIVFSIVLVVVVFSLILRKLFFLKSCFSFFNDKQKPRYKNKTINMQFFCSSISTYFRFLIDLWKP